MAKIIYSLKIYLYHSQFNLSPRELSGLRNFDLFIITIYLKAWCTAPSATTAPRNDLDLIRRLQEYNAANKVVANAAIQSFSRHLWYLSETLIGLAFFDSTLPVSTKHAMVAAMDRDGEADPPLRRMEIKSCDMEQKIA